MLKIELCQPLDLSIIIFFFFKLKFWIQNYIRNFQIRRHESPNWIFLKILKLEMNIFKCKKILKSQENGHVSVTFLRTWPQKLKRRGGLINIWSFYRKNPTTLPSCLPSFFFYHCFTNSKNIYINVINTERETITRKHKILERENLGF